MAACPVVAFPVGSFAQVPIDGSEFDTQGWVGSAFYDASTGEFDYCRQGRTFDEGIILTFTLDASQALAVGLIGGPWPNDAGASVQIAARLDGIGPFALTGTVDTASALVFQLADNPAFVNVFRRGYVFEIVAEEFGPMLFSLAGTATSLTELGQCVTNNRDVVLTAIASDAMPANDTDSTSDVLQVGDLARLQARPEHNEPQTFGQPAETDLASRLTGGNDPTTIDTASDTAIESGRDLQPDSVPQPVYRPYRIGDDSNRFGSGGLYGTPYTIRPPSAPYSISTPGTASPYRR